jgi:uncharacterized coiled-coil protein SlyX
MSDFEKFQKLKTLIEGLEKRVAQSEGAIHQLEEQLTKYGCFKIDTISDILEKLRKEEEKLKSEFKPKLDEFIKKYWEKLK